MENVKSFTFKVAKATTSTNEVKVREGVAVAGCSLKELVPGSGWYDYAYRGSARWGQTDNGPWC